MSGMSEMYHMCSLVSVLPYFPFLGGSCHFLKVIAAAVIMSPAPLMLMTSFCSSLILITYFFFLLELEKGGWGWLGINKLYLHEAQNKAALYSIPFLIYMVLISVPHPPHTLQAGKKKLQMTHHCEITRIYLPSPLRNVLGPNTCLDSNSLWGLFLSCLALRTGGKEHRVLYVGARNSPSHILLSQYFSSEALRLHLIE